MSRLFHPGTDSCQLVIFEKFYGMFGCLQLKFLPDQTEPGRIKGLFELDMIVAMEFDFFPDDKFRWPARELPQQVLFCFIKKLNGLLSGGSLYPDGDDFSVPALELLIGIGKRTKIFQWLGIMLTYFTPASTILFFFGSRGGQDEMRKPYPSAKSA